MPSLAARLALQPMNKNIGDQIAAAVKRTSLKIADIEYRIVWNEETQSWDVLRNGVLTEISGRRKRKSAEDSAICNAKAELETAEAIIVVTCVTDRKLVTLWRGPRAAQEIRRGRESGDSPAALVWALAMSADWPESYRHFCSEAVRPRAAAIFVS